jgi:hypothetical protein
MLSLVATSLLAAGPRRQHSLQVPGIPCPECPDGTTREFVFSEEEQKLLDEHSPRVVVADGCSASTAVLHLASKVLGDLGMPIGTICDTPKAKEDTHKMWDCSKGTPSTDEIMRCENNAYCVGDDSAEGMKFAALEVAMQGKSLLFKGELGDEWNQEPEAVSFLKASKTKGVALVRCNHLDKILCKTRSCIEFNKYGEAVLQDGTPTNVCEGGHMAESDHSNITAEDAPMAKIDLSAGGMFDKWLDANVNTLTKPFTAEALIAMISRPQMGDNWECAEDLLLFEDSSLQNKMTPQGSSTSPDRYSAAMNVSVAAWRRFAAALGACETAEGCWDGKVRNALWMSGKAGSYPTASTCDEVHNCDELKEALEKKGTLQVKAMFRDAPRAMSIKEQWETVTLGEATPPVPQPSPAR